MANTSDEFINSTVNFSSSSQFEHCFKGSHFGLIVFYLVMTLCFFLGTPAHLWCLWFYFGAKQKIKVTQVLFLNHTFMEIINCLVCSLEIMNMTILNDYILWNVISFCSGLCWIGRPLLQACICIEQYMAVIHPVTFLKYKSIKYRISAAVAAWLMAFAYGVYMTKVQNFPDFIYTFVFIIALVVISFCCVSVLFALKNPGPGDKYITKQTSRDVGNQQKRNAFNIIFSALLLILFTYLPQTILIFYTGPAIDFLKCNIILLTNSINIFGATITPMIKIYKEFCSEMSNLLNGK